MTVTDEKGNVASAPAMPDAHDGPGAQDLPPDAPGKQEPYFPEYRLDTAPTGARGLGLPSIGLVGITAGMAQMSRQGAPPILLFGLPVLFVLLYITMRVMAGRSITSTGGKGITVRTPLRTVHVTWSDVQAVEIHGNPATAGEARAVNRTVSVYYVRDGAARSVGLPHLNNRTHTALDAEVEQLRALWKRLRGPGWQRLPQATARLEKAQRSLGRSAAVLVGLGVGAGVFVLFTVIMLALLIGGYYDNRTDVPFPLSPGFLMPVPAVVCGVVAGVLDARRRARRGQA
ncbi:hypothetical protein [Streptomyces malaysiensis]|uniref:hypothetical protein n=1 Tax=Streptomyces malaysiensis TaxID=92644 RepID=UPI00321FBCC6|nr:hypothetical protein [Streptomyces malaysiensis]